MNPAHPFWCHASARTKMVPPSTLGWSMRMRRATVSARPAKMADSMRARIQLPGRQPLRRSRSVRYISCFVQRSAQGRRVCEPYPGATGSFLHLMNTRSPQIVTTPTMLRVVAPQTIMNAASFRVTRMASANPSGIPMIMPRAARRRYVARSAG